MNYKALINDVREFLAKQGKRAWDEETQGCMYRTPDGLKCAIGCLLPDELYDPAMENRTASFLSFEMSETWALFMQHLESKYGKREDGRLTLLMDHLQSIHDFHVLEDWDRKFQELIDTY